MVDAEGVTTNHLAYIAGFFDGEGTLIVGKYPNRGNRELGYRGYMAVANTYVPILEWIQSRIGGKIALQKMHGVMTRACYSLTFSTGEIRKVLPQLLPYLVVKKEQAKVLLAFLERQTGNASAPVSEELLQFYEMSYQRMKQLKVTRFEYVRPPELFYVQKCMQCEKEFQRSSKSPRKIYCSLYCKKKRRWTYWNHLVASRRQLLPVAQQEMN